MLYKVKCVLKPANTFSFFTGDKMVCCEPPIRILNLIQVKSELGDVGVCNTPTCNAADILSMELTHY